MNCPVFLKAIMVSSKPLSLKSSEQAILEININPFEDFERDNIDDVYLVPLESFNYLKNFKLISE